MLLEGWSFLDALYMTAMTLSTVGFREVRPLDTGGQLFTMTLIVMGVLIVLVTISVIAGWVADEQLGQARRRRRMEKRADRKSTISSSAPTAVSGAPWRVTWLRPGWTTWSSMWTRILSHACARMESRT